MFELHIAACAIIMGVADPICVTVTSAEVGRGPFETIEACEAEKPIARRSNEFAVVSRGGIMTNYADQCVKIKGDTL